MGQALNFQVTLPEAAPILETSLCEDLRLFLLASLPEDETGFAKIGFETHVDHPLRPGHQYMEGYFHALASASDQPTESIHPRFGHQYLRKPAPRPFMAFCEAIRRANQHFFDVLERDLSKSPIAAPLAEVLRRRVHFADLSVQIHWGDSIPPEHVAWHVDAANSFLHMAIGLQGRRALHARRSIENGRVRRNCAVGATDDREVIWLEEGSAYFGSPCCYPHAVEYPSTRWEDRIVAVQCRLLLNEDELFGTLAETKHTALDIDPKGGTAAIVFRHCAALGSKCFVMPQLAEVQAVVAEMASAGAPSLFS